MIIGILHARNTISCWCDIVIQEQRDTSHKRYTFCYFSCPGMPCRLRLCFQIFKEKHVFHSFIVYYRFVYMSMTFRRLCYLHACWLVSCRSLINILNNKARNATNFFSIFDVSNISTSCKVSTKICHPKIETIVCLFY